MLKNKEYEMYENNMKKFNAIIKEVNQTQQKIKEVEEKNKRY